MGNKRCILLTLIVGVLVFLLPTNVQASAKKLTGNDRYEISFAITQDGWKQVDNSYYSYYAVLVLGDNFPDALSAGH